MSTTSFDNIESALQNHLATMSGIIDIAWPNVPFSPVVGTPYLRFNILFAEPTQSTLGTTGTNEHRGFAQIDCVYPSAEGTASQRAMAGLITERFKRGTDIIASGQTITVLNVYPSGRTEDGDWLTVPITINFRSITEN